VEVVTKIEEVRAAVSGAREAGRSVGFVATMGALHEGHLSLIRRSVADTGFTVVSNYVNPTQFGPGEDFEEYPRTLEADNAACEQAGVGLVYVPLTEELYPTGHATWVEVAGLSEAFEGKARPRHLRGVATVVTKLLNIVRPDRAYFGRKDAQQLTVIRRLVRDLCLPVEIVAMPTVRDADGLAFSSRNRRLSAEERRDALCLVQALRLAEHLVNAGETEVPALFDRMHGVIDPVAAAEIDYIAAVDPDTFLRKDHVDGPTLIVLAVAVGSIRLIDNCLVGRGAEQGGEA